MLAAVVILVFIIIVIAMVFAAVWLIKPKSFKLSAGIMKLFSFSVEIREPSAAPESNTRANLRGMAGTSSDRVLLARISGTARRYAAGRPLTAAEEMEAVAALEAVAAGRADLLAEEAGTALGMAEGDSLLGPAYRQAADLCIKAGADPAMVPHWAEVGRRRATEARLPYSG